MLSFVNKLDSIVVEFGLKLMQSQEKKTLRIKFKKSIILNSMFIIKYEMFIIKYERINNIVCAQCLAHAFYIGNWGSKKTFF
jgi:hypothetical protein